MISLNQTKILSDHVLVLWRMNVFRAPSAIREIHMRSRWKAPNQFPNASKFLQQTWLDFSPRCPQADSSRAELRETGNSRDHEARFVTNITDGLTPMQLPNASWFAPNSARLLRVTFASEGDPVHREQSCNWLEVREITRCSQRQDPMHWPQSAS